MQRLSKCCCKSVHVFFFVITDSKSFSWCNLIQQIKKNLALGDECNRKRKLLRLRVRGRLFCAQKQWQHLSVKMAIRYRVATAQGKRNLAVNFSRQGKHREFSKFKFLHRENCGNTGKMLKI